MLTIFIHPYYPYQLSIKRTHHSISPTESQKKYTTSLSLHPSSLPFHLALLPSSLPFHLALLPQHVSYQSSILIEILVLGVLSGFFSSYDIVSDDVCGG
jgi:hypothetical protein